MLLIRVVIVRMRIPHLVKKFITFYGIRRSLSRAEVPTLRHYPLPDESTSHFHTPFLQHRLWSVILTFPLFLVFQVAFQAFRCCFSRPYRPPWFDHPIDLRWEQKWRNLPCHSFFFSNSVASSLVGLKYLGVGSRSTLTARHQDKINTFYLNTYSSILSLGSFPFTDHKYH